MIELALTFVLNQAPNLPPDCKEINRGCGRREFTISNSCLPGVPCLPWCPNDGSIKPPYCRNGSESGALYSNVEV